MGELHACLSFVFPPARNKPASWFCWPRFAERFTASFFGVVARARLFLLRFLRYILPESGK
jgi:hypothetical protein